MVRTKCFFFFKEKEEMVPSAFETNGYLHSVLTLFLKKRKEKQAVDCLTSHKYLIGNGHSKTSVRGKSHLNTLMYFLVKSLSMLFIYVITTIIRTRILLLLISSGSAPALCLNKAAGGRQRLRKGRAGPLSASSCGRPIARGCG